MLNIDNEILDKDKSNDLKNQLIKKNTKFIKKCAIESCGRFIDESDEEWSVALCAFSEAIDDFSSDKGSFYAFSKLVIKRRILDHAKAAKHKKNEILIDPALFAQQNASDGSYKKISSDINDKIKYCEDNPLKDEIDALSQILLTYGFSFFDLIGCSPKSEKTKNACKLIVNEILQKDDILQVLRSEKQLPIKYLQKDVNLPRKIFDRHRKYIIAAVEIFNGEYPCLAAYMYPMRKDAQNESCDR